MKKIISVCLLVLLGCGGRTAAVENTTADSTLSQTPDSVSIPVATAVPSTSYEIPNESNFISEPYDFPLIEDSLKVRLGPGAAAEVKEFEGGADFGAYFITTVKGGESNVSFYSFSGKHSANIYTPQLPLKRGIVVGMQRADFLKVFGIDENATATTQFTISDTYGSILFTFSGEVLYNIDVFYEEGD